jgi:NADPH2:quinone reductase
MRAVSIARAGGPSVLEVVEVPDPVPGAGEVTIDVTHAGVGLVDTFFRSGRLPIPLPAIPGIEVSGHIRALGPGVEDKQIGQRVAALLNDFVNLPGCGGYAEITRARAALTVGLPDDCELADAASVLVNGTTARMALRDVPRGRDDARILVLGATGGLGGLIGRTARRELPTARLIGMIGSASKRQTAREFGYDEVCTPDELAEALRNFGGIDAAFDTVGGQARRFAFESLAPLGQLVILGNASGSDESLSGDQIWLGTRTVSGLSVGSIAHIVPDRIAFAAGEVLAWAAAREIDARPALVMLLEEAAEAHGLLERREIAGKIVLEVRR